MGEKLDEELAINRPSPIVMTGVPHGPMARVAVETYLKARLESVRTPTDRSPERGRNVWNVYSLIDLFVGGRSRIRTYDPLIKSQLLYHLSYAPDFPSLLREGAAWG